MAYNAQTQTITPDEGTAPVVGQDTFSRITPQAQANYVQNGVVNTGYNASGGVNMMPLNQQNSLAITPQSLQNQPTFKLPTVQQPTTSAGIIASTQPTPAGWDPVTYANFKKANPGLEPTAEDTARMSGSGTQNPSYGNALQNYTDAQSAVGTQGKDAQSILDRLAQSVFGQKSSIQATQQAREEAAGLRQQQEVLAQINTEMANEQVALRGEQEKLRQQYGSEAQKQISNNTLNDTYGRRLADLAIRQGAAQANVTAIQAAADRQTKLLTAPLDTQIEYLSTFGRDNVNALKEEDKNKLNFIIDDVKQQKAAVEKLQDAKTQMIMEIAKQGGGTNTALVQKIQNAGDIGEVATLGAQSGYIGALDRAQLDIARANLAINQAELRLKIDAAKPVVVKDIVNDPTLPAQDKNNAVIRALISSGKIEAGAKTNLQGILGVTKAIEDIAKQRPDGKFTGLNPLNAIVDNIRVPFTDVNLIPFREAGMRNEAIQNRGYLDAINLKVQQWASGASLTDQQVKQVNKLVPTAYDTDDNVKTKLNNLSNFMNTQVSGTLASQGVNFVPDKVDLFAKPKASAGTPISYLKMNPALAGKTSSTASASDSQFFNQLQ